MDETIPPDIMEAADEIAYAQWLDTFQKAKLRWAIARAILAERLRCHSHVGSDDAGRKILSGVPADG